MIRATWCNSGNVGDRITPWLIEQMTGQSAVYVNHNDPIDHCMVCGSTLGWATEHTTVWGSGILSREEAVNPLADIRAVRGPLTRQRAIEFGAECPEVYGDPGLLVSQFRQLERTGEFAVGVVPHYVDQYIVAEHPLPDDWQFISVFQGVENFARDICRCDVILSSALHGLVLADAYGVPSIWTVMGSRLGGDGVKFADYFASVGRDQVQPVPWKRCRQTSIAANATAELGDTTPLIEPLLAACPFGNDK